MSVYTTVPLQIHSLRPILLQTDPLLSKTQGMKLASSRPDLKEIHRPTQAVSGEGEADPQQPVATGLS